MSRLLALLLTCAGCFTARDRGAAADGGGNVGDGQALADASGADAGPLAGGETCEDAVLLPAPGQVTGSTIGRVDDYEGNGLGCPGSNQAPGDVVYAIAVPPMTRLEASIEPVGGYDSALMIVDDIGCEAAPAMCLSSDDTGDSGHSDVATWANGDTSSQTVYLIVDGYDVADREGEFTLRTVFDGALIGETCATPKPIAGVGELRFQTTAGFANDYDGAPCAVDSGSLVGGDRVYRIAVPAGATWEVFISPGHGFDPTLWALVSEGAACGTSCAGVGGTEGAGVTESIRLEGLAGGATYLLVVDGVESGAFTLSVRDVR